MGLSLKTIRETGGFSVESIAEKLGISSQLYRIYEDFPGLMPTELALKFSELCKISVDYIFFG